MIIYMTPKGETMPNIKHIPGVEFVEKVVKKIVKAVKAVVAKVKAVVKSVVGK